MQGKARACTVTHKSSHPDPTSRFTAPVPADFPAQMGVTMPQAASAAAALSAASLIVIPL